MNNRYYSEYYSIIIFQVY